MFVKSWDVMNDFEGVRLSISDRSDKSDYQILENCCDRDLLGGRNNH